MLPKPKTVVYDITIPGTDKVVKMRGFTVKEYKVLLQAKEFGDDQGFINTVRNIISDCLFNEVNIDELPMYVIDYLFLMIRSKSVGEEIDAQYVCKSINEAGDECGAKFGVTINLKDVYVKYPPNYNEKCIIDLGDGIGMKLKSPTFSKFRSVGIDGKGLMDITDEFIFACVDCVYNGDEVLHPGTSFTFDELKEWIESFSFDTVEQITEFFKNQPFISLTLNLTCPKCKTSNTIELNGLDDFFD